MNLKINSLKKFDAIFGRLTCSIVKLTVKPKVYTNRLFIDSAIRQGSGIISNNEGQGLDAIRERRFGNSPYTSSRKVRILVIRPGGIGDLALLYPAFRVLKDSFDNPEIDILAEKRNSGLLIGCPYTNRFFLYDLRPPIELIKALLRDYDIVIDTEQWHRLTAAVSYLTRAPIRVGFATNERGGLFTHPVSYNQDEYEVYSFLNLVTAITGEGYKFNENEPFIPVDSGLIYGIGEGVAEFRKRWTALIGVFCGATIPERRWGLINFAELSKRLSNNGFGTVLVGGRSDVKEMKKFEELVGSEKVLNLVGKTSLMETAALISLLDIFVSGDSGIMHIAYGVGTPTVSLFGAGIQKKWAPIGENHITINKNLPCSPCTSFGYTPRCPYDVRCLKEITVEDVTETVLRLLSRCKKNNV